jgi:uncharacterized protein (DUF1697 family)
LAGGSANEQLYVALLRAINVGGHTVTMDRLRGHFSDLGLKSVRSYIQTGNVFFESPEQDRGKLTTKIEKHLRAKLGYDVGTFLRTIPELEKVAASKAFAGRPLTDDTRHCVLFLSEPLPKTLKLPVRSASEELELVHALGSDAMVVLHLKRGRTLNAAAFMEKTYKVRATARFFHTTAKILAAAKGA